MKLSYILQSLLIVEIFLILSSGYSNSIDYQDEWILKGLEIPFAFFMITYAIYIHNENRIAWIVIFALICRSAILIIPNIKYNWFMGVAIDQHSHYRFTQDIFSEGFIPAGRTYSEYPIMHLLFVVFSSVTKLTILNTFKYLPIFWWLIYPLLIYSIMKNLGLRENPSLKYALFISSIPVTPLISYSVCGILLGALLVIMVISQFTRILIRESGKDWIILLIYISALALAHLSSSIILTTVMLIIYLLKPRISSLKTLRILSFSSLSLIVIINLGWFLLKAVDLSNKLLPQYMIGAEATASESIPSRFFGLDLVNAIRVILVSNGGDMILLLFSLIGIVVAIKKKNLFGSRLRFLIFYNIVLWSIMLVQFITGLGGKMYLRFIMLSLIVSPIFSGISIYYFSGKKTNRSKASVLFLSLIMILATIELYTCQPFVPSASVVSKDLPSDEPITYVNEVNSAYQRYMIEHAERYIQVGLIACDTVTRNQIIGLTNYNFSLHHLAWYYPLSAVLGQNSIEKEYDYFLIHFPGKSGAFQEKAEMRTRSLVLGALNNSNILYTNGESHILAKTFTYSAYLVANST